VKETLKKIAVALLAAAVAGAGTALGELARDAIKSKLTPAPVPARKKSKRRKK